MQFIDGDRGQQRLDTRDQGDGQHAQKHSGPVSVGRTDQGRETDRVKEVARQGDPLGRGVGQDREGGRDHDCHQGAGDHANLGRQLWPEQQDRNDHDADDHIGQMVIQDPLGQRLQVLPRGASR